MVHREVAHPAGSSVTFLVVGTEGGEVLMLDAVGDIVSVGYHDAFRDACGAGGVVES